MGSSKLLGAVAALAAILGIGFAVYHYSNRDKITEPIVPPLAEEQEAFEISDPPVDESRKLPLEVLNISPGAENVSEVHQISVTFNKPMVPLGDMEKSAQNLPVKIDPAVNCHWRWLNRMSLGCQLDEALPDSNLYSVTIGQDMKAYDGTQLAEPKVAVFSTLQWNVVQKNIQWKGPDLPTLYWTFNQPMKVDSLLTNMSSNCGSLRMVDVPKKVVEKFSLDPKRTYAFEFEKNIGGSKSCKVEIKKEAVAQSGPENGFRSVHNFSTFPEFKITKVRCQYRVNTSTPTGNQFQLGGCDPDTGVSIELSVPVYAKDLAGKIKVEPFFGWTKGGYGSPEYMKQNPDSLHSSIRLASPLNGNATHSISLDGLKDRFGRPMVGASKVEIRTIDFTPHFDLKGNFGVMEKNGPHQLAYSSVNYARFDLKYYTSNSENDLNLWRFYRSHCADGIDAEFSVKSKTLSTGAQINQPVTNPIDIDKLSPGFKYGMFWGSIKNKTVIPGAKVRKRRYYYEPPCESIFTVVTDLGITAKVGYYDSGVWIHSIGTGKPLAGVKVQLREQDKIHTEAVTDSMGFAKLDGAQAWDPERKLGGTWTYGDTALFVVAQTQDDFSMLPFDRGQSGITPYAFSDYQTGRYVSSYRLRSSKNHIVHAMTDRALYQPNQPVKLKVFARHWEPRSFGLKPAHALELFVKDSRGKEIFRQNLKLSEYGTAHAEFNLTSSASLGRYTIQVKMSDKWTRRVGSFNVQEFTLPPFKVLVEPLKKRFVTGDSAAFRNRVLYHFGGGLANTKGKYVISFEEKRWKPKSPMWNSFQFDDPISINLAGYEKPRSKRYFVLEEGSLKTNKEGEVIRQVLLSPNQIRSYGKISFESKFKDDRGKTIAGQAKAEVFYSDFFVGLKKDKWAYEPGEKIKAEVVLVSPDERAIPGAKVKLKLVHRDYQFVRTRGSGNYFSYETRTSDKVVDECETHSKEKVVTCPLRAKAAGSHYIIAESTDRQKRLTQSSLHLYVTGSEYIGWYRNNNDIVDIVPDKEKYKVGEDISLLVKSPYDEVEAVFTLERFGILKQFRRKLVGGAEIVKIPVNSKDYAPGFFISVHLIKGRVSDKIEGGVDLGKPSFKMGMVEIKVENPDSIMEITSKTNKTEYEPGDEVQGQIMLRSPSGKRQAELAIAVVDEKILQLAGDYKDNFELHKKFYQLPGVDVITSQMLSYLIGRRHFGRKGAPEGGDGDGINARKNFLPLAYWNPALETDSSGKATFKFKLPDNLTGWRVLVVAVDKEHRFGFGGHSFKTTKKLMIEPALPSFLTEGDQLKGRFAVFNRTGQNEKISGSLKVDGLTLKGQDNLNIDVNNEGKGFLEWLLEAPFDETKATLTVRAKTSDGKNSDAAQWDFPIRTFASYETFSHYGSSVRENLSIPLEIPEGIRPNLSQLNVIISPTLLAHLDEPIRYGLKYPYYCWEQRLNKILMLSNYIGLKDYTDVKEVNKNPEKWIQDILATMSQFQASNGGMGYWKSHLKTVDPYLSVFTALGMTWLNQAKIPIPRSPSDKVFQYTKGLLEEKISFPTYYSAKSKATVLAMAAYVRSLLGDDVTSYINKSHADLENLSLFGKSFLWSAASKNPNTKEVSEALRKNIFALANLTSGQIQFQESQDDGFHRILHSTTRTNCRLLVSLLEDQSDGPFVQPLVRWIIGTRRGNRWNNTQENIFCLNALINYASIYEKDVPNFTVSGKVGNKTLRESRFKGFKQQPSESKISLENIADKKKTSIEVTKKGTGRFYYTTRLRVAYKKMRSDAVNAGLQVTRKYYVKDKNDKWMAQSIPLKIKRGDLVKIELKVKSPSARYHVALADSLPAGLEPVNSKLGGTSKSDAKDEGNDSMGSYYWDEDSYWWGRYSSGGFYHREMRLFGAQYFADHIPRGTYTLKYIAQAIAVGEFNVSPALVEQMYDPEVYGKSKSAKFIIVE